MQNRLAYIRYNRRFLTALILISLVSFGIFGNSITESASLQATDNNAISKENTAVLFSLQNAFSSIADSAEPGVVSITAVQRTEVSNIRKSDYGLSDIHRSRSKMMHKIVSERVKNSKPHMILPMQLPQIPVTATGSGLIVRRQGSRYFVLTNNHVVENAYRVKVRLYDGTVTNANVIGSDKMTDLAVLQISSSHLTERNILPLGDSNAVKVGSWALAVGSPFGFEKTLTVGVVSALHRELEDEGDLYLDLIQTDAAINRGNSGGPLLNMEGKVIGVNAAIASPTGGYVGLGFAIPINTVKEVLDDLIEEGRVIRGWLGIGIQEMTPVLQEYYGVESGVLIASVDGKGPGSKAGLISEDIITKAGDTPITETVQLQKLVAGTNPGSFLPLQIIRDGKETTVRVQVDLSPSTPASRPSIPTLREETEIKVQTLTGDIARKVGLKGSVKGVIVTDIAPGGPAEDAGLEEGDVIVALNSKPVTSENQFNNYTDNLQKEDIVILKIIRDGTTRIIGFHWE